MSRHVSVILLYNKEGKFLFQHRAADAKRRPNMWGFFGGGIEPDETPVQAIVRETQEELGYKLKNPLKIWEQQLSPECYMHVFVEKYDERQPLHQTEGQNMAWVTYAECKNLEIIPHDLAVIEYLEKNHAQIMADCQIN